MQGFIPQEDEADIHDVLKGFKCIFLAVDDDILAIETRRTSIAYLNGYDVDITPMYWFADKRYISEFENNLRRGDCKSIPFLKSRDFDKIVITDSSESRIIVENYLNECNLSYIVVERGGNYSPFYVIDISSFN
ncbi:hypothetical protein KAW38_04740 [Candidatus Micrarchaeota archaeon]|nr:hypothetical protein [Candidatus Micrarchaeota archaeon]